MKLGTPRLTGLHINFLAVRGHWWRIDEWGPSVFGPVEALTFQRVSHGAGEVLTITDMEKYLTPRRPRR